jgi:uncharacterized protein YdiU (UPF0061 family)
VFSSIDRAGRYAYGNQPVIARWNLMRFAETLLPLISDDPDTAIAAAQEVLYAFEPRFDQALFAGMRRKLGLFTDGDDDIGLIKALLDAMTDSHADFTLTFRALSEDAGAEDGAELARALFAQPAAFDEWAARWRKRLAEEPQTAAERRSAMLRVNPRFIPRNHRVEAVIAAAVDDDFGPFEELLTVLAEPYAEKPAFAEYAEPPAPDERVLQTFCGT